MNKELNVDEISIDEILDFIADQNSCNGCPITERCSTDDCYRQIEKWKAKVSNDRTNNN